jgi:hypothetical protein
VVFLTGIQSPTHRTPTAVRYFTLQGTEMTSRPQHGIYLERIMKADGSYIVRKISLGR